MEVSFFSQLLTSGVIILESTRQIKSKSLKKGSEKIQAPGTLKKALTQQQATENRPAGWRGARRSQ